MSPAWFSAMLRFVVLVEDEGGVGRSRSLILLRATDFPEAKLRAAEVGRNMERSYRGGTGANVRWRLESVESIDLLGDNITDGREVYSESIDLAAGEVIGFEAEFRPDASEPGQTGV